MIGASSVRRPSSRRQPPYTIRHSRSQSGDITVAVSVSAPIHLVIHLVSAINASTTLANERIVIMAIDTAVNVSTSATPVRAVVADLVSALNVATTATTIGVYIASMTTSVTGASHLNALYAVGPTLTDGAETWVLNMETHASSQYDDFGFNSYAFNGTNYLAAAEDGIYELAGDDDAGATIESLIKLPKRNLGLQQFKRTPNMWLGVNSDDSMVLKVEAEDSTYYYTSRRSGKDLDMQRVDLGRGLHASYWTFTLTSSADFELESIQFEPIPAQRRI